MSGNQTTLKSPADSIYATSHVSGFSNAPQQAKQRRLKSARLVGEYEKPWLQDSPYKKRELWDKVILWSCVSVGFLLGCVLCYFAYANVPRHKYCLILDDDFTNLDNWSHEIQIGGFGTGSFDWTTDDPRNSYISHDGFHIIPTITLDDTDITVSQLLDGFTLNLTESGTCTSTVNTSCAIRSNSTAGTIINPVRSARITTKGKKMITYGRVEVVAKLPAGDWLWPAIWMMPENSVYGEWPMSGEIDIVESRGNSPKNYSGGRDTASSALHWGLDFNTDKFLQTTNKRYLRRTDYSKGFHTFGLEWSSAYLYTYIDNRLLRVLSVGFGGKNMWIRSGLAKTYPDRDPWSQTGRANTPFDEAFYLILNVAVGGTGGYFLDSVGGKPWIDWGSATAARDFWKANHTWLPTWGPGDSRGMTVKSAKMWQEGACP